MWRIGFSCCGLGGGKSGIATYVFELLRALEEVDCQNEYELFISKEEASFFSPSHGHFHKNVLAKPWSTPFPNIFWHHLALPLIAAKKQLDLCHIPTLRRIPLLKKGRLVATVHDLAPLSIPYKYGLCRHFYHQEILSRLIRRCDHVIAVSHYTKSDLLQLTNLAEEKISVIYSGIDGQLFFELADKQVVFFLLNKYYLKKPFIVYVARIEHPGKNHLNLIKAFEQLKRQEGLPHHLVFAGADWNGAATVKAYVEASPFKESIHFLGFVPKEDLPYLYSGCALMAFPSLYEGFGFPILEALACGATVVAAATSALQEIGQGYVQFFDPLDSEAIALALKNGLTSKRTGEKKEKAKTYAHSFTWKKTAQEVLKVYQKMLGKQ